MDECLPLARTEDLIVVDADGETLVYDLVHHRAHCLNPSAATVWRLSDGTRSITRLTAATAEVIGNGVDEDLVWYTLRRLNGAHLLARPLPAPPASVVPRRELLRRLAAAGVSLIALPAIATIIAPTTLQAQVSCLPEGSPCDNRSGLPCCAPLRCQGQPPGQAGICR